MDYFLKLGEEKVSLSSPKSDSARSDPGDIIVAGRNLVLFLSELSKFPVRIRFPKCTV